MKDEDIDQIYQYTNQGRYEGTSRHLIPRILNPDAEAWPRSLSIPNDEGSYRITYTKSDDKSTWWKE